MSSVVAVSSLIRANVFHRDGSAGTTSLAGLVTTPPIEPVVVDCANATALRASTNKLTKQQLYIFDIQGNSLANELTLNAVVSARRAGDSIAI